MVTVEVRKGDTVQLNLEIKNNGEPFVPDGEKIVFSVGRFGRKEFSIEAGTLTCQARSGEKPTTDVEVFFLAKKGVVE